MTPTPTQPPGSWYDYASRFPADMPDVAYDAQRDQYFETVVKPWAYRNGMGISKVREQFMAATPRPGKSEYPRLELGAKSAARALLDPIAGAAGFPEVQQFLKQTEAESVTEAQKQGINPAPYAATGSMAGQLPYWYAGMEAAGLAAGAVAPVEAGLEGEALAAATANLEKTRKLFNVAAGMAVQGGYDAARAEDGHRAIEGVRGALEGGALMGAFGYVPGAATAIAGAVGGHLFDKPGEYEGALAGGAIGFLPGASELVKALRASGLSEASAKAVEASAKGVADEAQVAEAGRAVEQQPQIVQVVAEAAKQGVKAGKRQGRPAKPTGAEPTASNVQVVIDANESRIAQLQQQLLDLRKDQIPEAGATLSKALEQGVTIDSINGDPENVHALLREVDSHSVDGGLFDTRIELNGEKPEVATPTIVQPFEPLPAEGEAAVPPEQLPAASVATPTLPANPLIESLKSVLLNPKLSLAQKQASRLRLQRLSPDALQEIEALAPPSSERVSAGAIAPEGGVSTSPPPLGQPLQPGVLMYSQTYHGTTLPNEVLKRGLTLSKSRGPEFGGKASISLSENRELARSMSRGELGNIQGGDVLAINTPLKVIDLTTPEGEAIYKQLDKDPQKVLAAGYDGVAFNHVEDLRIEPFYKDVKLKDVEGAKELQIFHDIAPESISSSDVTPLELSRMQELSRQKALLEGVGQPSGRRLGLDDVSEFDQLEQLKSGKIRDKVTGRLYSNADEALRVKGLKAPDRFASQEGGGEGPTNPLRRLFLKRVGGAAASAGLQGVTPEALGALTKGAEAGNSGAKDLKNLTSSELFEAMFEEAGEVFFSDAALKVLGQLNPRIGKAIKALEELNSMSSSALGNILSDSRLSAEDLANPSNVEAVKSGMEQLIGRTEDYLKRQRQQQREWEERVASEQQRHQQALRSGTVTPGMELARTHAPLGEEGTGGLLMRYAEGEGGGGVPTAVAERPTQTRVTGQLAESMLPPGTAAGTSAPPGQRPTIYYRNPSPTNMFHESLHGAVGFFDLTSTLDSLVRSHPTGNLMEAAFTPQLKELYGTTWPEEAFAYAASAVRTGNNKVLQPFIDADTDRASVLGWVADNADSLLRRIAERPDSPYRSVAERRLREVLRRSTGEIDLIARDTTKVVGDELGMRGGEYVVTNRAGVSSVFDNRDGLVSHLEEKYEIPLSAPSLVDESLLPEGLARPQVEFDAHSLGRAPIYTGPPEPTAFVAEEPPEIQGPRTSTGRVRGGVQALSAYIRPGYAWLDSVARKNDWPELYDKFKAIDQAQVEMNNFTRPYRALLNDIFSGVKQSRQSDLYRWLEASTEDKDKVAAALHISDAEVGKLNRLREEFFNPLFEQFGIHSNTWIENYAPRLRDAKLDPDAVKPQGKMTPEDIDFFAKHVRTGELDPYDTNLSRVTQAYLRLGAREKFLGEPLKQAAELVNLKTPSGEFATGTLRPILQRWVESVRGIPDYTGKVIDGAMQVAVESINDGIEGLNRKLPENLQIEPITSAPRDIIGKWIMLTYAGQLGLRPMVPIRDFLTTFITGYPILGGKYLAIGAKKAFEPGAFQVAQEAGALLEPNFMRALYNTGEQGVGNALNKVAEATLKPTQWSNNVSRLVSFWGHNERALDAMEAFAESGKQDVKKLIRDSALTFVDESLQKSFVKEITSAKPEQYEDIAKRVAKELTEVEHWNYRTGANPGIYKYTLGRLFGQYGTWPLNYIEYARRIVANGDKVEAAKALTRLAIAHGAILSAGQHMGIDTAQWVFTQPMAYGGGPLMQAVINIPGSFDFESYKGAEARHNVVRPFFPTMIPGANAMERIHKALSTDDPDLYKILLGFVPMKSTEQDKFWHQLVP